MSADRIAMLERMCAHRDAQIVKLRMDRSEIQDEIEQLKGLVKAAYIQGCRSHGETTWWGDFHKWASQHGILTSEKATEQYLNDPSEEHLEIEIFNEGGACL